MHKPVMLAAATMAVVAVAGCGGSSKPHTSTLAPVSAPASHISIISDKTACQMWHKSMDAVSSETETVAAWSADTGKAVSESGDPAFRRDAAAAVNDAKAGQYTQMAADERAAVNDCAADGVSVYGP